MNDSINKQIKINEIHKSINKYTLKQGKIRVFFLNLSRVG